MTVLESNQKSFLPTIHSEIVDELGIDFKIPKTEKLEPLLLKSPFPTIEVFDTVPITVQYPLHIDEVRKEIDINLFIKDDQYHYDFVRVGKNRDVLKAIIFVLEEPPMKEGIMPWRDTVFSRSSCLEHYGLQPLSIPEICTFAMSFYNPFPILCYGSEQILGDNIKREIVIIKNRKLFPLFKRRNSVTGVAFGCASIYQPVRKMGRPLMYVAKEVKKKNKK